MWRTRTSGDAAPDIGNSVRCARRFVKMRSWSNQTEMRRSVTRGAALLLLLSPGCRRIQEPAATAAFVGARVLAKTFGLANGFASYDDDIGNQRDDANLPDAVAERRAAVVTEHALEWLKQNGKRKFFLWAHYFDPHAPYDPPEP